MENKFERAAASLEEMIGEMTNDDGSLDDFIEDLNLAIECLKVVKHLQGLIA